MSKEVSLASQDENSLDWWIRSRLHGEEHEKDSEIYRDKMNELCYKVFFLDKNGAELMRMFEFEYFTNPASGIPANQESLLIKEGIRDFLKGCIANARRHINQSETSKDNNSGIRYCRDVRRGR